MALWNSDMYYVYVLISLIDNKFYTGFTENLNKRFSEHNEGASKSTKYRRPFELVCYEACRNRKDAINREKYLKTTYGKNKKRKRLKNDSIMKADN